MRWIQEHKKIFILILVGILILAMIIGSAVSTTADNTGSEAAGTVFERISRPFTSLGRGISSVFSSGDLKKENEKLQEENNKLKRQISENAMSEAELQELQDLKEALNYQEETGSSSYVTADITSMDKTSWMALFTINAGSEDGVKEGSIVVSGDGLVGTVKSVGKGWAKVVTLLDTNTSISFQASGNADLLGILESSDGEVLTGYLLDSTATITEGTTVITSGLGTLPGGIPIGKVTKVRYDSNAQLSRITVQPAVNFSALRKVMVLS